MSLYANFAQAFSVVDLFAFPPLCGMLRRGLAAFESDAALSRDSVLREARPRGHRKRLLYAFTRL